MLDLRPLEMDTTHTPDAVTSLNLSCVWTLKQRKKGIWTPIHSRKNLFTSYGLSQLVSAFSGVYMAPQFLVVEGGGSIVEAAPIGVTTIRTSARIDQIGDTQLILSVSTPNEEVVTFSGVVDEGGVFAYALSTATTNAHSIGDKAIRKPLATDTITSLINEKQYDPINAPNKRLQSVGGFSGGAGSWTIQFFLPGPLAASFSSTGLGLSETEGVGTGHLHNHLTFAYTTPPASQDDLELDVIITFSNG